MRKTQSTELVETKLRHAETVAREARAVRVQLRRNSFPGGERQPRIEYLIDQAVLAARPIRRWIGMLGWHEELEPYAERLRKVSKELTTERRALRKMLR